MVKSILLTTASLAVCLSTLVHYGHAVDDRCTAAPNLSYIPSPNACYLYYNCIDGNAYPLVCPEDLWFSMEQQECVTKDESDCLLTEPPALPEAPAPEPSPLCDDVPNFNYVASPDSCQWYYQCIDRIAYLLSCPLYYWFDPDLQRCGTRFDVQCDRDAETTTTLATPATVDPLDLCYGLPDFTLVPSVTLCERFYSCYQGNPYPENCPSGLWFNPNTNECDDPDNVECAANTAPTQSNGDTPLPGSQSC